MGLFGKSKQEKMREIIVEKPLDDYELEKIALECAKANVNEETTLHNQLFRKASDRIEEITSSKSEAENLQTIFLARTKFHVLSLVLNKYQA